MKKKHTRMHDPVRTNGPASAAFGSKGLSGGSARTFARTATGVRVLLDNFSDAYLVVDAATHRIAEANAAAAALLSRHGRQLRGSPLEHLLPEEVDLPAAMVSVGQQSRTQVVLMVNGQAVETLICAVGRPGRPDRLLLRLRPVGGEPVKRRTKARDVAVTPAATSAAIPAAAADGPQPSVYERIGEGLDGVLGSLYLHAQAAGDAQALNTLRRSRRDIRRLLAAHQRLDGKTPHPPAA